MPLLDLDYSEDSTAEVDANVVMTGDGGLVEVQATAERTPLSRAHLDDLLLLAEAGIGVLRDAQQAAVASRTSRTGRLRPCRSWYWPRATTHKLAEVTRMLAPFRLSVTAAPARGRAAARGRRHLRGQRSDQGARRVGGAQAAR